MVTHESFYVTGGTLQRDAPSYVERQADFDLYLGLLQAKFCYVLTSRQMGKSSLMVRTAGRLREEGIAVAVLDLTAIGQNLTAEQWYDGLLGRIGRQLDLENELESFWLAHDRLNPLQRWTRAIREVVLARYDGKVVIFVDEIDTVRSLPFSTDEFFAAIREFYNRRTEDAELSRLTFCLLGVATPADLIRDTLTTPFNIGQRIELIDFTEKEASPLVQGLGRENTLSLLLLKRVLFWTGGHPYLTQRLCQALAEDPTVTSPAGVDRLCEALFLSSRAREQDDNLLFVRERILRTHTDLAGLLELYKQVHSQKPVRDDDTDHLISILRLSGITRVIDGLLHVRNRIYYRVFDLEWVAQIEKEIGEQVEGHEEQQRAPRNRLRQRMLASAIGLAFLSFLGYQTVTLVMNQGEILILSDPGEASIILNGEMKGITVAGKLQLSGIKAGTYRMVAHKSGYVDKEERITITKGKNPDKQITLRPALAVLVVRTNQPGVRVLLDGKDQGVVTGTDGSATIQGVTPGSHSLILSKEGFTEWKENRELSVNWTTEINTTLNRVEIPPTLALLRITSEPPDANVIVDGKKTGITSGGSLTLPDLKPGIASVSLERDGYQKKETRIPLVAGRASNLHFVLSAKPAVFQLITTPPVANAVVKINDSEVGKTDASGSLKRNVPPGENQVVSVIADNYEKDFRHVHFKPGKVEDVRVTLTPRASIPTMALLSISSTPSDAEVYVDENRVASTPTGTIQVTPGRHKITIKKEKYRDKDDILEFKAGEPKPLSYPLEKLLGRLEIVMEPPGVTATIEGQNYNLDSEREISLVPGLYTVLLAKSGYKERERRVVIQDQKTTLLREKLEKASVPASAVAGTFSDEFRNLNNWENPGGWRGDGTLLAKGTGAILSKGRVFRDFTEKFQVRLTNSLSASFVVRAKDSQNFYLIQVTGDNYEDTRRRNYIFFYVYKDGNETEIKAERLPFDSRRMKDWFTIKIEVNGNRFRVIASGILLSGTTVTEAELATFIDPENVHPEGKIGFRISGNEEFRISGLVVATPSN